MTDDAPFKTPALYCGLAECTRQVVAVAYDVDDKVRPWIHIKQLNCWLPVDTQMVGQRALIAWGLHAHAKASSALELLERVLVKAEDMASYMQARLNNP